MVDVTRLRALLDTPDTAWIVERMRARLERGADLAGNVTVRAPSVAQRAAVAKLFGRPTSTGQTLTVDLGELDALLRHAAICDGIVEAVPVLIGVVVNRRDVRESIEASWDRVFDDVGRSIAGRLPLAQWLTELRATGLLRRLAAGDPARARTLLDQALLLGGRLPGNGVSLAELAVAVSGDSHALDAGAPLGTIATRLAQLIVRHDAVHVRRNGNSNVTGRKTVKARDVWAAVGILCDELSAPVLVLNVTALESTHTGRAMSNHAEAGEPYRLSVRQLLRTPPDLQSMRGSAVFVCENPSVVSAAANRLGAASAPLVCVEGQPRTAAGLLLARLAAAGAQLAYHGDFDWGGLRIGNVVIGNLGARAWRFSAADYEATAGGRKLAGRRAEACWDGALSTAMISAGRAVHEEQVIDDLLSDLSEGARRA